MSPEIQEWSHKSRSRINNLYLLTRPIQNNASVYVNKYSGYIPCLPQRQGQARTHYPSGSQYQRSTTAPPQGRGMCYVCGQPGCHTDLHRGMHRNANQGCYLHCVSTLLSSKPHSTSKVLGQKSRPKLAVFYPCKN